MGRARPRSSRSICWRGGRHSCLWHERLALMPMLWVRAQIMQPTKAATIHMLISRHRDGRLIGSILRRFGVQVVHDSSAGGAVTAMRRTMALLKDGQQVAITPDGPRTEACCGNRSGANRRTLRCAGASLFSPDLAPARSAKLGSDGAAAAIRPWRAGMRAPHPRPTAGLGGITSNDRDRADRGRRARGPLVRSLMRRTPCTTTTRPACLPAAA
jgi:hypothetical protein